MLNATYYDVYECLPATCLVDYPRKSLENHHDHLYTLAEAQEYAELQKAKWVAFLEGELKDCIDESLQEHLQTYIEGTTYEIEKREVTYKYACNHLWTDVLGFEIIKVVSENCIEVRRMRSDIIIDNNPQLESDPCGEVVKIRRKKNNPEHWGYKGRRFTLNVEPYAYQDPNF